MPQPPVPATEHLRRATEAAEWAQGCPAPEIRETLFDRARDALRQAQAQTGCALRIDVPRPADDIEGAA